MKCIIIELRIHLLQLWQEKIKEYGAEVTSTKQLPDDNELLTKTILEAIGKWGRNGIMHRRNEC